MAKVIQILVFVCLRCVFCVPPSPTSAVTDLLKAELGTMKNTIKVLSDQWEKWNTLFLTSLEPRITSTASTLASIDSNIHNLQERAHVWDTFQLHVSAWNEQLASLDRKVDIISKGQEKVLNLDGKINAILGMEYKLDSSLKILNNIYDSVSNLDTTVHTKKSQDVLFNEFATRGVLSSIKLVEKKLDRLLIINQNNLLKKVSDEKPKFTIRCNTPRILEDLLNDISSKVDVIFDNISNTRDDDDTDYEADYLNVGEGSGADIEAKSQSQRKRMRKAIRKIVVPCKQTNQALDEILNRVIRIENTSLVILDKENMHFEKLSEDSCESKLIDSINRESQEFTRSMNSFLGSYFSEQRAHFESMSNKLIQKCSSSKAEATSNNFATPDPPVYSTTKHKSTYTFDTWNVATTSSTLFENNERRINEATNSRLYENSVETNNHQPTWMPIMNQNKSSCEDLDREDSSGVYIFGNNLQRNTELFFNKRYCEIRDDGLWTVVQRRDNYTVQHNFNVSWDNYKYGFGDLHRDFWMGNDFLSSFSNNFSLILRIELEDFENHSTWAEYDTFKVSHEDDNYRLTVGGYSGNASDSFSGHSGFQFSTYDKINDAAPECCPCAVSYGGGWWFNRCFESNLNGVYYRRSNENEYFRGIIWEHWLGNYSLKKAVMMVKPKISNGETIPYYEDP